MKYLHLFLLSLCLPLLSFTQVSAERSVLSSGGTHMNTANLELSWTVGEVAVTTASTPNLVISQGFQQGDANLSGREDNEFTGYFQVYPNPVEDELTIAVQSEQAMRVNGQLYDLQGREVMTLDPFEVNGTWKGKVDLSHLPAGQWLLRFTLPEAGTQKSFWVTKVR